MSTLIRVFLTLILSFYSLSLHAQSNWFRIEMIVFKHIDTDSEMEEKWPSDVAMSYPKKIKTLIEKINIDKTVDPNFVSTSPLDIPDFVSQIESINTAGDLLPDETPLVTDTNSENTTDTDTKTTPPLSFQVLDKSSYQLNDAMAHLRRLDRYQPLFHKAWVQNLTDRDHSPGILITGGDTFGRHTELEGFVKVSVERYLHVETDLWLHQFVPNFGQAKILQVPEVPTMNSQDNLGFSLSSQYDEYLKDPYQVLRTVTLRENRRMRSREIHYLDHPLMGVIVVINPL